MTTTTIQYPDSFRRLPRRNGAIVAFCSALTLALTLGINPARAQDKPADQPASKEAPIQMEAVIVTGVRASLTSAREIKANAPELVDSIVAEDIGKLPDNTVADALQRVPGVQVSRREGEANTVVVRGLPNLVTTLNGYEVFTGTGRGVALQDIPAEMLAGVDVYKSVGADKIEGGVAGLIDVRLRRPFDFMGFAYGANARTFYSDQAEKMSYNASFLISNRWKTGLGDFGALLDVSYSKRLYQDQILDNYVHFAADFDYTARDAANNPSLTTHGYYADNFGWQTIPGKRIRPAVAAMFQLKTKNGLEFYSDNLFTGYRNDHNVDFFIGIPSWGGWRNNVVLYPAGYGGYTVADPVAASWSPAVIQSARFVRSFTAHDTVTLTSTQAFHDSTDTYQGAFGMKWDKDRIRFNGEFAYNFSTVNTKGIILDVAITSPTQALAITYNDGGPATFQASGVDYTNPSNYWLTQFYDQWSRAYSAQYALKADLLYRLDSTVVPSLQFGTRYSSRTVNFHQASPAGTFVWHAAQATAYPGMGRLSPSEPFVGSDVLNVRSYWTPDPGWLLNEANTNALRSVFGRPTGRPAPDQGSTLLDKERNFAAYAQANYKVKIGEWAPIDGVIGARLVDTDQSLRGYQHRILSDGSTSATEWDRTSNDKAKTDVLPMVNGKVTLEENLLLRFSWTKTETRPDFSALNPALTLYAPTMTVPGSGSGGNPGLDPVKSTNFDVSLEYYYGKTNLANATFFHRTLDGYIQNYSSSERIGGNTYNVNRPRNTSGGYLEGVELGYQLFLDMLPDAFKGLGIQANYTYIRGETKNPLTGVMAPIAQVSKTNYNIVLMYEKGPISSRLAYNWRGKFIESFDQPGLQPGTVWVQPTKRLDFSASYALTKNLMLTLDATNLLGSKYHDNFGDLPMFSRDVRSYDRTYELGLRYRY
jgi:iron complex outermembrane receptor protein